jgi:hypothetical protein
MFRVNRFQMVPLLGAAAAAAWQEQELPSSIQQDGNNTNCFPIIRFIPRRELVGSLDYQRRDRPAARPRTPRNAFFSFDLVSTGVAHQLAVVDIDNQLLLTISRRSMDGTGTILLQHSLVDESKPNLTVSSVVQRRSLTIVVVKHIVGGEDRFDVLVHNHDMMDRFRCASLPPGATFIDCFVWGGQLYVCTECHDRTCIDIVPDSSSSTKRADRSIKNHINPYVSSLLDGDWLAGSTPATIQAVATTHIGNGDDDDRTTLVFLAQSRTKATSWWDCHLLQLAAASRSANRTGTIHHHHRRHIHLKTAVKEAFRRHNQSIPAGLLEPRQSWVGAEERTTRYTADLMVAGDRAVTIHRLYSSVNERQRHRQEQQQTQPLGMALLVTIWNVADWDLLAVINVPLRLRPLSQFHLDQNRLVIFGADHIGCIIMIYQFISADTETLVADTMLRRPSANGSGGLHTFHDTKGVPRVRFVSRIRHPAMNLSGLDPHQQQVLQLACNERFIVVRTGRGNQIDEAAGESDGLFIIDHGPPPESTGRRGDAETT